MTLKIANILERTLHELEYVRRVVLSCETVDQFAVACDWANTWRKSRIKLMIRYGLDKNIANTFPELKLINNFKYNKN